MRFGFDHDRAMEMSGLFAAAYCWAWLIASILRRLLVD